MRIKNTFLVLFTLGTIFYGCEEKCSEQICTRTSVNFNFRLLDSAGNDLIFGPDSVRLYHEDSIWLIAQNPEAISFYKVSLDKRQLNDTTFYLEGGITSKHNQFFLRGADSIEILMDSILVKTLIQFEDTLTVGYITEENECCGILINRFDIKVNGENLCVQCKEESVYKIIH